MIKFPKYEVTIRGDAGIYKVWAIDWLNLKVQIYRASSYEWIDFIKVKKIYEVTN